MVRCWQTCGSRDLSLGLETSRDSGIKVLVLVLEPLSLGLGLGTPESWTLVLFLSHTSFVLWFDMNILMF